MPCSGPASAYGSISKVEAAYFKMINDAGGINGRKINLISLDRRLQPAEDGRDGAPPGPDGSLIEQCGDSLTRENVMNQAASLKDHTPNTLLPGIKIKTSAKDFAPIEAVQLMKFDGKSWVRFVEAISADTR